MNFKKFNNPGQLQIVLILVSLLNSCYQYQFKSITNIKLEKEFPAKSNINVIFGDGFYVRNGYNKAMAGINAELKKCNNIGREVSVEFLKYKFLNYSSKDKLPLNEEKIDMNLMLDNFSDINDELTEAELIAFSKHRSDLLFRIKFSMSRSLAPIYKTFYYHDPGIESGMSLGKEICLLLTKK
ncbi:hypothetical protein EHQ43_10120 [Leptospira bouyouniensis]|uniref:Uncharacterized protein n=1 Tax=Leptospira bouyouniensis TaxID=2484911 RepID=A0A7I0HRY2_9LEPT|nr:hypothetical protein [Leptospira bouyouniensis]TGL04991.1 hypothetical protein EHQ43_10120 [Leptospira bouyouniensis]